MSVLGFVDPEILTVFCDRQLMNGLQYILCFFDDTIIKTLLRYFSCGLINKYFVELIYNGRNGRTANRKIKANESGHRYIN